jgi:hypothetical protein
MQRISLQIDDVYFADDPVVVCVSTNIEGDPRGVTARIEPISGGNHRDVKLKPEGDFCIGEVTNVALGTYKVTVILQNKQWHPQTR